MRSSLWVFVLVLFVARSAFADGAGYPDEAAAPAENAAEVGSASDDRLPPVLPGEVVQRGGKKMRVWSSSGAVSVEAPPQPPTVPQPSDEATMQSLDALGVIVDRRDK